jgi:hypothetical protein
MLSIYTTERTSEYITFTLNQTEKMFFKSNKGLYQLKSAFICSCKMSRMVKIFLYYKNTFTVIRETIRNVATKQQLN